MDHVVSIRDDGRRIEGIVPVAEQGEDLGAVEHSAGAAELVLRVAGECVGSDRERTRGQMGSGVKEHACSIVRKRVAGETHTAHISRGSCLHVVRKPNPVAAILDRVVADRQPVGSRAVGNQDPVRVAGNLVPVDQRGAGQAEELDAVPRRLLAAAGNRQNVASHLEVDDWIIAKDGPIAIAGNNLILVDREPRGACGPDRNALAPIARHVKRVMRYGDVRRPIRKLNEECRSCPVVDREAFVRGAAQTETVAAGADVDSHAVRQFNGGVFLASRRV